MEGIERREKKMKKNLLAILAVFAFGITVMGCATKGDLEKVQAQEQQMNLKADQALKASQEANESARKASEAAKMADERARAAEERAKIAEERAERADAMFKGSMKK
jgi:murein lipoprotein